MRTASQPHSSRAPASARPRAARPARWQPCSPAGTDGLRPLRATRAPSLRRTRAPDRGRRHRREGPRPSSGRLSCVRALRIRPHARPERAAGPAPRRRIRRFGRAPHRHGRSRSCTARFPWPRWSGPRARRPRTPSPRRVRAAVRAHAHAVRTQRVGRSHRCRETRRAAAYDHQFLHARHDTASHARWARAKADSAISRARAWHRMNAMHDFSALF